MSAKFEPLRTVVAYYLNRYKKSIGDEDEIWVEMFCGLDFMHFNTQAEPKTIRIQVLPNQTALFPSDYVQWSKIGILDTNGKLSTLKINTALTTLNDLKPNRLDTLTPDVNDGWFGNDNIPFLNYIDNGSCYHLFGIGGGLIQYGECRVDEKNELIVLAPDFKYSSIMLEYISAPERDNDYMVDRRLREPLMAWCAWKFRLDSDTNFYARYTEARRIMKPVRMQVFNDVIREGNKFCLKG